MLRGEWTYFNKATGGDETRDVAKKLTLIKSRGLTLIKHSVLEMRED